MWTMDQSTIAAISTPVGSGGIGIIRISGPDAISIAKIIFKQPEAKKEKFLTEDSRQTKLLHNRRFNYGFIVHPDTKKIIDEVLVVSMTAPHTYTREDVVEIQSHCSPVVLNTILQIVLNLGARLAEPGEFTKRAFLNGRIDLTQAEAVADIINAKTELSLEIANEHLSGKLTRWVKSICDDITRITAELQAAIEFSEEIDEEEEFLENNRIRKELSEIEIQIENTIKNFEYGQIVKDGIRLSITGRPNVGKSSLLNCLLKKDRAIVTPLPGTTRDLIEEYFTIKGVPVYIADMAGIHDTQDPVELIGIEKARKNLAKADIVLFLTSAIEEGHPGDKKIEDLLPEKNTIKVINKCDLIDKSSDDPSVEIEGKETVRISALTGKGLDELKSAIVKMAMHACTIYPGNALINNLRQKRYLERALISIKKAGDAWNQSASEEFICADINEALSMLMKVLGKTENPDILDEVFSRFCIGK